MYKSVDVEGERNCSGGSLENDVRGVNGDKELQQQCELSRKHRNMPYTKHTLRLRDWKFSSATEA